MGFCDGCYLGGAQFSDVKMGGLSPETHNPTFEILNAVWVKESMRGAFLASLHWAPDGFFCWALLAGAQFSDVKKGGTFSQRYIAFACFFNPREYYFLIKTFV